MITTVEEYNKQLAYVIEDLKARVQGLEADSPPHFQTYDMNKPIHVLTANTDSYVGALVDKGDHYEMVYPRFGSLQKSYTNDFCWIIDKHTVFLIERPFRNRVVRFLRKLLPNNDVRCIKNDLIIDNVKIGPTCMAGQIVNFSSQDNPLSSSLIYCLRWDNVEGLDDYFAGDPNHEARKQSNIPLGCLSKFLPTLTREQFMQELEAFQ